MEPTNAGTHVEDGLGPPSSSLQPLHPVIIRPQEPVGGDVPELGELGQGALQLVAGQVEGVVVDLLAGVFEGLEEEADLPEVPLEALRIRVRCSRGVTRIDGESVGRLTHCLVRQPWHRRGSVRPCPRRGPRGCQSRGL